MNCWPRQPKYQCRFLEFFSAEHMSLPNHKLSYLSHVLVCAHPFFAWPKLQFPQRCTELWVRIVRTRSLTETSFCWPQISSLVMPYNCVVLFIYSKCLVKCTLTVWSPGSSHVRNRKVSCRNGLFINRGKCSKSNVILFLPFIRKKWGRNHDFSRVRLQREPFYAIFIFFNYC